MKTTHWIALGAALLSAGCASNDSLSTEDVREFPLGGASADVIAFDRAEAQPVRAEPTTSRTIAAGVALDPSPAQDDDADAAPVSAPADQLDLENRVVALEGKVEKLAQPHHSIAFIFGYGRTDYDDDDLDPIDDADAYSLDTVLGPSGGLGMDFTIAYAREKEDGVKLWNVTPAVGFRYTLGKKWIQPYIGAGYEVEYAKYDTGNKFPVLDDHSWAHGPYVRAGINIALTANTRWFIGADYRYGLIGGEHDFGDDQFGRDFEPDAEYERIVAFLGFRF